MNENPGVDEERIMASQKDWSREEVVKAGGGEEPTEGKALQKAISRT